MGTAVCKEVVDRGIPVASVNRSGAPRGVQEPWVGKVQWIQGDLSKPGDWAGVLSDARAVVSCVGSSPASSKEVAERVNGEYNQIAARAASQHGVPRFVYVSAHMYGPPLSWVSKGYWNGKRRAEAEVQSLFGPKGVILRPSVISGTRRLGSAGSIPLPIWLLGSPWRGLTNNSVAQSLNKVPLLGPVLNPLLVPPVRREEVAKAAVAAALDDGITGVVDVPDIIRIAASASAQPR